MAHLFGDAESFDSNRHYKITTWAVLSASIPTMQWVDVVVTFNQDDIPNNCAHPGRFPIMVSPLINNSKVKQVLINRGSSLSIIYATTLDTLEIHQKTITHESFYRIRPGMKVQPLGYITLLVTFECPNNFQTDKVSFKVVNFVMAYNDILGLPALARFTCVPHYVYQLLKMFGPGRVITILWNPKLGVQCDKRSIDLARQVATLMLDLLLTPRRRVNQIQAKDIITIPQRNHRSPNTGQRSICNSPSL